jgi:hypothetical protein
MGNPRGGPLKFGAGIDPVAAGRKGGKARRSPADRVLAHMLSLGTRQGMSVVYRELRADEARHRASVEELERRASLADRALEKLMDATAREREIVAGLREERARLGAEVVDLRARLDPDRGLDSWLEELGEERIEASLSRLGWLDEEEEPGAADAAAA